MSEKDQWGFEEQPERIKQITDNNRQSFLMDEHENPIAHKVVQSLHSVGADRKLITIEHSQGYDADVVKAAAYIGRKELVGNVSPLNGYGPKSYSPEEKVEDAQENIHRFLADHDVDPENVRMLRPERDYSTPLSIVNADEIGLERDGTGLQRPIEAGTGDFIYSFDPDVVLAARPADCPIVFVTAETPKGQAKVLLHLAWKGVAHGYVNQAKEALNGLAVNWDTVRVQVTPGGQASTFTFNNYKEGNPQELYPETASMFTNVIQTSENEGDPLYSFGIDLTPEVYEQITEKWDVDPYQVFVDTTDTTSSTAGYSSHSRSYKGYEGVGGENSRDIVMLVPPKNPKG